MGIMRDEVAHPADGFALKKTDALAGLKPLTEEGFDGGAGGAESGGEALAVELGVAVERAGVASEASAVVLEPAGMNLLHVGKLFGDGASARSERNGVEA